MYKSSFEPLQVALHTQLTNYTPLMEKITGVFDDHKDGMGNPLEFPYIIIGEWTAVPWDTVDWYGEEVTATMHVWVNTPRKMDVHEIINLTFEALSESLSLEGDFFMEAQRPDMNEVVDDPEEGIKHGIIRFRFLISQ